MHVDIGVLRGARLDSARHLNKQGRRARPSLVTCSLIESELYSLSTAGAIAFTACTAAPGQLASLLLRQAPLPTTQPADSLLWTGITVLSALPFCGWVVWPGIGYLRARLDDDRTFSKHYAAFAALYALPLIRAALFGMDELALISVFFCVLHVQAERLLSPVLLPIAAASPTKRLEDTPAPSAAPIEAQVEADVADVDAIDGWDRRWTLRSMSVSQLLTLSRSRMTKRQLLEALEAVGVHETLQPAQRVVKNSIEK